MLRKSVARFTLDVKQTSCFCFGEKSATDTCQIRNGTKQYETI